MAYLECVHQLRLTAELIHRHGVAGMRERISGTARYGDLTRGPRLAEAGVARAMADILSEIESGAFMREWRDEVRAGSPHLQAWRERLARDSMEAAGRDVRAHALRPEPPEPGRGGESAAPDEQGESR
jgi:ketol-acid reductoisomerase